MLVMISVTQVMYKHTIHAFHITTSIGGSFVQNVEILVVLLTK